MVASHADWMRRGRLSGACAEEADGRRSVARRTTPVRQSQAVGVRQLRVWAEIEVRSDQLVQPKEQVRSVYEQANFVFKSVFIFLNTIHMNTLE